MKINSLSIVLNREVCKVKRMPSALKQKLRQYDKALNKANSLHSEIVRELEKYNVPYDNLTANSYRWNEEPRTEALAFINNNEGNIEDNIDEIEDVFLYFVNKETE